MSKNKGPKKKVVVSTQSKKTVSTQGTSGKQQVKAKSSRSVASRQRQEVEFTFKKDNFMWMGIGIALIAVGMFLMGGGQMPSPEVWDDGIIYSFRRTVLAPLVILAGLGVQVYAIFKK
ncbi:MAG: DUF3098 domain-containing protein [Saprospiraceae bacterium]|nr:DUF3098 domain-containing protein [Saprospiraceae bacterium]